LGLLGVHPIGGCLSLAGGGEDGAGVVFQDAQPRGDIGGVVGPRVVGDTEIGQDEAGGQLGGRLLDGRGVATEASVEVAIETVLASRWLP
jgi:hypothetical protein